ncbi:MAG TPA: NAD(P)H-binding protein [Gammaproteobacteria bacterium]|nr:NAD(P)H-binding protein [Gammaproteobacteria bacterium]
MKIALVGTTRIMGNRIAREALTRDHQLTATVRKPARLSPSHRDLTVVTGDVLAAAGVAFAVIRPRPSVMMQSAARLAARPK